MRMTMFPFHRSRDIHVRLANRGSESLDYRGGSQEKEMKTLNLRVKRQGMTVKLSAQRT